MRSGSDSTCAVEDPGKANGLKVIRIRGGLSEHLRFFHATDPAITRKRSIEGEMVKTFANLRVAAIEPLGRALPLYDITTGTGDFIANGVVSHNCFARPTHKYLDFDAGRDFEREIVVKVNAPERLRAELARPSWKGEHVALGTNTDPYQWVEGRYKLMPGIWEAMRDAANPCSVLTKSPLLLRDLELMKQINERTDFSAALSVPTLDEKAWRATEPHTPNPRARLEAVAELTQGRHPHRRADRAADAGGQRRARAGRADPRARGRGRGRVRDRDRAAPTGRGAGPVVRMASRAPSRPGPSLRAAVPARRVRAAGGAPAAGGAGAGHRSRPGRADRPEHRAPGVCARTHRAGQLPNSKRT